MSSILLRIGSDDYTSDRFRWYEIYANETDIPDDDDVEGTASVNAVEQGNYFPFVGLEPGSSWYFWVRVVFDGGTTKSAYQKAGPISAPTAAAITAADISDASPNGRSILTAADYATMRSLLGLGTVALYARSTDGSLSSNSDNNIPTEKAVKAYADQLIASADAMVFKGVIDCSANPNYPAADRGHTYRVSVAGKIGGSSGVAVEAGDLLLCLTDSTASGNQATVGAAWSVAQSNLDGAVIGPASATDSAFAQFDGTSGKLVKQRTLAQVKTDLALSSADLSDFAQSNWTPTVLGTTTPGTPTYAAQIGSYEKSARGYTLRFSMVVTNLGGMAGNIQIGGLPAAATATSGDLGAVYISAWDAVTFPANTWFLGGDVQPGASTARLLISGASGNLSTLTASMIANGLVLRGVIFYRT